MNKIKLTCLFILYSPLIISCINFSDDNFSLTIKDNKTRLLRTNGYYFKESQSEDYIRLLFFYNNGIVFHGDFEKLEIEDKLADPAFISNYTNRKSSWGLYELSNNKIKMELYFSGSSKYLRVYQNYGSIINDTTFNIETSKRICESTLRNVCRFYHFREFKPKPDSSVFRKYIKE